MKSMALKLNKLGFTKFEVILFDFILSSFRKSDFQSQVQSEIQNFITNFEYFQRKQKTVRLSLPFKVTEFSQFQGQFQSKTSNICIENMTQIWYKSKQLRCKSISSLALNIQSNSIELRQTKCYCQQLIDHNQPRYFQFQHQSKQFLSRLHSSTFDAKYIMSEFKISKCARLAEFQDQCYNANKHFQELS